MTRIVITMTAPPRDCYGRGYVGGQVRAQRAACTLSANSVGSLARKADASISNATHAVGLSKWCEPANQHGVLRPARAHTSEAAKEGVTSGKQRVRYTVSMHLYFL